jgi:soluble lytic murein transglycosylase
VTRRKLVAVLGAVSLAAAATVGVFLSVRKPLRRRAPVVEYAEHRPAGSPTLAALPADRWTESIQSLQRSGAFAELSAQLEELARLHPDQYRRFELRYLHARAAIEADQLDEAIDLLEPYLETGHPFRDLALFYRAEIADEQRKFEAAARFREQLIEAHPDSLYRQQSIEDYVVYQTEEENEEALRQLLERIRERAPTLVRRDIESRILALELDENVAPRAVQQALTVLRGNVADDAAERIAGALDRPEILGALGPADRLLLAEAAQHHRHFERAVQLYSSALPGLPQRADDITFAIGRSHFGSEKYEEAEKAYLRGAQSTKDPQRKAIFLFHASRARQLLGDDAAAEKQMTAAIAVPGKFEATAAALTQRLRTRARAGRIDDARNDLALLRRLFPSGRSILEGSLALATPLIAAGRGTEAVAVLDAIPHAITDDLDEMETEYWRGRALEVSDPSAAVAAYLRVLRSSAPGHFRYFARQRLETDPLAGAIKVELERRRTEVKKLISAERLDAARRMQTDVLLLSPAEDRERELAALRELYMRIEPYRQVLELKPALLPAFPLPANAERWQRLSAMGLHEDAVDAFEREFPLRPMPAALTRSYALNLGAASRSSIYAVEVMMQSIPDEYVPELLPPLVARLLHPRYFHDAIVEDAEEYGADPRLVLSIMREESRFNPRAKSMAAARGLLQFIITTARDVGRDIGLIELSSEDLYDPRIVIRLGAKYIGSLLEEFDGNAYRAAAAYNAGPNQVRLWSRFAPAEGDDYFLSAVNFDETKGYVRKVMNSYRRYGELYGER